MKIRHDQSHFLYERILKEVRELHKSVLILPALSVDSTCGAKILSNMFKTDHIAYSMTPVGNYTELIAAAEAFINLHEGNVMIILIDCGASINVFQELHLYLPDRSEVVVTVFDSHRPIHHVNLRNENIAVRIQLDSNDDLDDIPVDYEEEESEDEDDDEKDDDDDDESGDERKRKRKESRRQRRRKRRANDGATKEEADEDEDDEYEEDEDEDTDEDDEKPVKDDDADDAPRRLSRAERERARRVLMDYYRTHQYGFPSSYTLHTLACSLGRRDGDHVWLAALGLAEHWQLERITRTTYHALYESLADDVRLIFTDERSSETLPTDEDAQAEAEARPVTMRRIGHLHIAREFVFPLYRHWTLYSSMAHARHVAVALRIWTEKGDTQLKTVLAKIGIPLKEAQRPYSLMGERLHRIFETNLDAFGPSVGITNNTIDSFVRQHSTSFATSALDTVLAIGALLSAPTAAEAAAHAADSTNTARLAGGGTDAAVTLEHGISASKERFWRAVDALTEKGGLLLRQGIDLCINQCKAVMRQAVAMLGKKEIDTRNIVHFGKIEASPDLSYFMHPDHLIRLGFFLLDLISLKKVSRPLVLGVLLAAQDAYLVVGINANKNGSPRLSATIFADVFKRAADMIGAVVRRDSFNGSVVMVRRQDWSMFMEQLVLVYTSEHTLRRF